MKLVWEAIKRTLALVATEIAAIMAAGSLLAIDAWKAAVIAGLSAAMTVWASIGKAYYEDGKLTKNEVDDAFRKAE
jgi:hypothetical protein